jgi:hypothetical protein
MLLLYVVVWNAVGGLRHFERPGPGRQGGRLCTTAAFDSSTLDRQTGAHAPPSSRRPRRASAGCPVGLFSCCVGIWGVGVACEQRQSEVIERPIEPVARPTARDPPIPSIRRSSQSANQATTAIHTIRQTPIHSTGPSQPVNPPADKTRQSTNQPTNRPTNHPARPSVTYHQQDPTRLDSTAAPTRLKPPPPPPQKNSKLKSTRNRPPPHLGEHLAHARVDAVGGLGHHDVGPARADLPDLGRLGRAAQQRDLRG